MNIKIFQGATGRHPPTVPRVWQSAYLIALLVVDGDFDIVEALEEQVDVPERVQMHYHLQDCSQRHYNL